MEESDEGALLGLMEGKFYFKKLPGGILDKSVVLCKFCKKEFAYHRSTSTLRYHLNAKHVAASTETAGAVSATSPDPRTKKRVPQTSQASDVVEAPSSGPSTSCDLDTMDLDQLRREKLKMQIKVLKLQEEYYTQKIKDNKK